VFLEYLTLTHSKVFIASIYLTVKLIQLASIRVVNGSHLLANNKVSFLFGNGNLKLMYLNSKVISLIWIHLLILMMELLLLLVAMTGRSNSGLQKIISPLLLSQSTRHRSLIWSLFQKRTILCLVHL